MKETSRMSSSRAAQGSRPRTFNSPSYEVSPRIAFSAVVLPAPLGPMSPRMRPSSTRKSTPSTATVLPKVLRRPRASMHGMASAFLLFHFRLQPAFCRTVEQFVRREAEPLNRCVDPGPFFGKELLAFVLQQQIARAVIDEHAETSLALDKPLVHQLLIPLQNRERIDPVFGRDVAHRWQCIAFFEHAIEYHRHDTVAKLAVNRLTVVPLTVHPVFQIALYETYSSVILPAAIPVSVPQVRAMTLEQRPVCYSELQHQLACKRFFAISLPRPPSLAIRRRQREERCPSETGQSAPDV